MNHGYQFDAALSAERKAEQERKQAEREARKKLEAAAPDLLAACKDALEIIAGERITYDAFPPKDHLTKILEKIVRRCEEKLETAIKKAKGN